MHPKARREGILTREIGDELILYDRATHVAHRLNAIAAVVWGHCDGRRSIQELAQVVGALGEPADEELVHLALTRLSEADLLSEPLAPGRTLTRRDAVQQMARAAGLALLPVVTSIVAPTPADAQSGNEFGIGNGRGNGNGNQNGGNQGRGNANGQGRK